MQGFVDQLESALLVLDQFQGEFLIIVFCTHIRHVKWDVRQVTRAVDQIPPECFIGHLVQVTPEPGLEAQERQAKELEFVVFQETGHVDPTLPIPRRHLARARDRDEKS